MRPSEKLSVVDEKQYGPIVRPILENMSHLRNLDVQLMELDVKRDDKKKKIDEMLKLKPYLSDAPIMIDCIRYIDHTEMMENFFVQLRDILVKMCNDMSEISLKHYVSLRQYRHLKKTHESVINRINAKPEDDKINKFLQEARDFFQKKFDGNELTKHNLTGFRVNYYRIILREKFSEEDREFLKMGINEIIKEFNERLNEAKPQEDGMGRPETDIRTEDSDTIQ